MNFLRIVLATVLSFFLMGQAFANANEARILDRSASSDETWQAYLGKLAEMTLEIDGQKVKGYDSETGHIFTALVMQRVCYNQAEAWKQACANPGERYTLFAARNGWTEAFVPQAELRQQVRERGVFFPFAAQAAVAAASAPQATPAPAAVAVAPAPVVSGLTTEQIAGITSQAIETGLAKANGRVDGLAQALSTFNGQLAEKDRAIAELRTQLAKAPSAAKVGELTERLSALETERSTLGGRVAELSAQLAKAPTLEESAEAGSTAAKAIVDPIARQVKGDLASSNTRSTSALALAGIALLAVLGSVVGLGILAHKVKVNKRGTDLAFAERDRNNAAVLSLARSAEAEAVAAKAHAAMANSRSLNAERHVASIKEIVDDHANQLEAAGKALKVDLKWKIAADEAVAIKTALAAIKVGQKTGPFLITTPEGVRKVIIEAVSDGKVVVHGIVPMKDKPEREVNKEHVLGTIRVAYLQHRLIGLELPNLAVEVQREAVAAV